MRVGMAEQRYDPPMLPQIGAFASAGLHVLVRGDARGGGITTKSWR
jgi:hypothetical protein